MTLGPGRRGVSIKGWREEVIQDIGILTTADAKVGVGRIISEKRIQALIDRLDGTDNKL